MSSYDIDDFKKINSYLSLMGAMNAMTGGYPGIGQGGGGHFSKFPTRVAKMSISISSAYSHGEVYIRMLLTYSVFL